MKKIYSYVSALALISSSLIAQEHNFQSKSHIAFSKGTRTINRSANNNLNKSLGTTAAAGDTVGLSPNISAEFIPDWSASMSSIQLYRFGSSGGGNIFGKNGDSINMCAQGYLNLNNTPLVINKVIFWAYDKDGDVGSTTSSIRVGLWTMAPNKAYNSTATSTVATLSSPGPNIQKAFVDVPWLSIDTIPGNFTDVTFATPVTITGNFAISINTQSLAPGDTIGILATQKGFAQNNDLAFNRFQDPNVAPQNTPWIVADVLWSSGMDVSLALFAVLDIGTAVNEYVNGIKLNALYPNPSKDMATISYSLEKESNNVALVIYNSQGKKVYDESYANKQAGDYTVNVNTASYSAGSYYYQLHSNGRSITKEFIVTK